MGRPKKLGKQGLFPYLLNLPIIAYITIVMLYPIIWGVSLSFTNKAVNQDAAFIGFENYRYLFTNADYWSSIWVTLRFVMLSLAFKLILGTIMALTLNSKFRFRNAARALLLIPWTLPNIAVVLNWRWIFATSGGIINAMLKNTGLINKNLVWTGVAGLAFVTIVVANVWKGTPFFGISILAQMQTIPDDYYEAARIDGANFFQSFFHITLPLVKNTMILCTLMSGIWTMNEFETVWLLTGGGPNGATEVMNVFSFKTAMSNMMIGRGLAVSIIVMPLFIFLISRISKMVVRQSEI